MGRSGCRIRRHLRELQVHANLQTLTTTGPLALGTRSEMGGFGFSYEPLRGPIRVEASLAFATYPQRGTSNANIRSFTIHPPRRPVLHTCRRRLPFHSSPERGFITSARSVVADVTFLTTDSGLFTSPVTTESAVK